MKTIKLAMLLMLIASVCTAQTEVPGDYPEASTQELTEEDLERPDRHILEQSNRLHVIRLAPLAALGAFGLAVAARLDVNDQGVVASNQHQFGVAIDERLETFDLIQ